MSGTLPTVTVAVLNRGRPQLLPRVLEALRRLRYRDFEVIVVGDRPHVTDYNLHPGLKGTFGYIYCAEANVSQARNFALAASRGDVVAYCDDDAVPEPNWLCHLARAFKTPRVGAAGGWVRGLDGIQHQWSGGCVSSMGEESALPQTTHEITVFQPDCGIRASVLGCNSAFRRRALHEVGGFDESFRYYLDETDAVMRLIDSGWAVAHVPRAEVHHAYAENAHRTQARKPRDFFEIAASFAHFCCEHGPEPAIEAAIARFRARKLGDLDRFIRLGVMSGSERRLLERRFDAGIAEGMARRSIAPVRNRLMPVGPILPFAARVADDAPRVAMTVGWFGAARLREAAVDLAEGGSEVSFFHFGVGREAPKVRFDDGVWHHSGGTVRPLWGWVPKPSHRAQLARAEIQRVMPSRAFQVLIRPAAPRFAFGALAPEPVPQSGIRGALVVEPLSERHRGVARQVAARLAAFFGSTTRVPTASRPKPAARPAHAAASAQVAPALGPRGAGH